MKAVDGLVKLKLKDTVAADYEGLGSDKTLSVSVVATDKAGDSSIRRVTIEVKDKNDLPVFTSLPLFR